MSANINNGRIIPPRGPVKPSRTWPPEGYRRPKGDLAWASQVLWGVGGLLAVLWFAGQGSLGLGLILALVCLLSIVWIEFESRCEDRKKVWAVFAVIMALAALWAVRTAREEQVMRDRREAEAERLRGEYDQW